MFLKKKQICFLLILLGSIVIISLILCFFLRTCQEEAFLAEKTFRIARDSTWYPLHLFGKEKNMIGFSNDLIKEIAKHGGFRVQIFEAGPYSLFEGLDRRKYDAILSSLTPTIITKEKYLFSEPFYLLGLVLIIRKESDVRSLKEMRGKIVGIEGHVSQILEFEKDPELIFLPYEDISNALEAVATNKIDGALLDFLRANALVQSFYADQLKIATPPLTDKGLRLISRKEPQDVLLLSRFNEGLKFLKEENINEELIKKWGLLNPEKPCPT